MEQRRGQRIWRVAGAILLACGCVAMSAGMPAGDEDAVRTVLGRYAEAVTTGDIELCRQLCWGGEPPEHATESSVLRAAQNVRPVSTTSRATTTPKLDLEVTQVWSEGDWALAAGMYTLTWSGSSPVSEEFLAFLSRTKEGWKIVEVRRGSALEASLKYWYGDDHDH
jgi:hypothetical protein